MTFYRDVKQSFWNWALQYCLKYWNGRNHTITACDYRQLMWFLNQPLHNFSVNAPNWNIHYLFCLPTGVIQGSVLLLLDIQQLACMTYVWKNWTLLTANTESMTTVLLLDSRDITVTSTPLVWPWNESGSGVFQFTRKPRSITHQWEWKKVTSILRFDSG